MRNLLHDLSHLVLSVARMILPIGAVTALVVYLFGGKDSFDADDPWILAWLFIGAWVTAELVHAATASKEDRGRNAFGAAIAPPRNCLGEPEWPWDHFRN